MNPYEEWLLQRRMQMPRDETSPSVSQMLFAPFNALEAAGTTVYNNLLMPTLNVAGVPNLVNKIADQYQDFRQWLGYERSRTVPRRSMAQDFRFKRENMISPDYSMYGLGGLLGYGRNSGFVNADTGESINRDIGHGSAYSSILANKNPEAVNQLSQSTGGQVALTFADMGVDPLTWIGLGSGISAVNKARKVKQGIDILRRAGAADDVIKNFVKTRLGRAPHFLESMAGIEDPYDFFRQGRLFNRTPYFNMGDDVAQAAELYTNTARRDPYSLANIPSAPMEGAERISAPRGREMAQAAYSEPLLTGEANPLRALQPETGRFARIGPEIAREQGTIKPSLSALTESAARQLRGMNLTPNARKAEAVLNEKLPVVDMARLDDYSTAISRSKLPAREKDYLLDKIARERLNRMGGEKLNLKKDLARAGFNNVDALYKDLKAKGKFSLREIGQGAGTFSPDDIRKTITRNFGDIVDRVNEIEEGGGLKITFRDGGQAVYEAVDTIPSPTKGKTAAARYFVDNNGVHRFEFSKHANKEDVFHEFIHYAVASKRIGEDEYARLLNKYARGITGKVEQEEAITRALTRSRFTERGILAKIRDWFNVMYTRLTGRMTAATAERNVVSGKPWNRGSSQEPLAFLNKRVDSLTTPELKILAHRDPLTGIRNKRAFEQNVPVDALRVDFDINAFKGINDTFGHGAGDRVLKDFAKKINAIGGEAYRLGGDEFTVTFKDEEAMRKGLAKLDKEQQGSIVKLVSKKGEIHDVPIYFSKGAGRSKQAADQSLYLDKERGIERGIRPRERGALPVGTRATGQRATGQGMGRLASPPRPGSVRFSAQTTLDKLIESQHIKSLEEPRGFVMRGLDWATEFATSKQARADTWNTFLEHWVDNIFRARSVFARAGDLQAGKKGAKVLVTPGGGKKIAPKFVLRDLMGRLSGAQEDIIKRGLPDPDTGKRLYQGDMVNDVLKPMHDYLKRTKGTITKADQTKIMDQANARMVARRLSWLNDQARSAVDPMIDAVMTNKLDSNSPLVYRGIIREDLESLQKIAAEGEDALRNHLLRKVDEWANSATGIGEAVGRPGEDLAVMREVLDQTGGELGRTLDKMAEPVRKLNEAMITYARKKGRISAKEAAMLRAQSADYASFQRVFEEGEKQTGTGGNLVKTLKGSARAIQNPLTSMIDNAVSWKKQIDTNDVFQRLVTDIDEANLGHLGITRADAGMDTTNALPIWIDGRKTYWNVADPKLLESIQRIGRAGPLHPFIRMVGAYSKVLKYFITRSPGFALFRNPVRDTFSRAIFSESGSKVLDVFKKFSKEEVDEFIRAGGDQAGWFDDVKRNYAREMAREMRKANQEPKTIVMRAQDFGDFISGSLDKWDNIVSAGERQNRLAEFTASIKKIMAEHPDLPREEAALLAAAQARDLMDFAVVGEYGRIINAFVPFFNPAIQDLSKLIRTAKGNKKTFAKRTLLYIGMPSIGTYMYNKAVGAGDEYLNLPEYRRDMAWNFKVGDHWIVVPKPFEAGVLGTFYERAVDFASGNKQAFRGYVWGIIKAATPVDEGLLAGPYKPVMEIFTNRDLFRDRYIVPPSEEKLDIKLRYGAKKASGIGKAFARVFGGDPRQFEHLISNTFGDFGRLAITATKPEPTISDILSRAGGGIVRKSSPYALQGVQDVFRDEGLHGTERTKGARVFRQKVRAANENPTRVTINQVLSAARQRKKQLKRITIDDILRRRKKK